MAVEDTEEEEERRRRTRPARADDKSEAKAKRTPTKRFKFFCASPLFILFSLSLFGEGVFFPPAFWGSRKENSRTAVRNPAGFSGRNTVGHRFRFCVSERERVRQASGPMLGAAEGFL